MAERTPKERGSRQLCTSKRAGRIARVGGVVLGLALVAAAPALAAIASHTAYVFANAPAKDWKTTNQSIVIKVTGAEATPTIHYSLDGGLTTFTAETATATIGGEATFTVDVTTDGSHEFVYWISQEGTSAVEATKTPGWVNVDKTDPVTTATAEARGGATAATPDARPLADTPTSAWWSSEVTVTLTATDTVSGLAANYPTYRVNDGNLSIYEVPFVIAREGSTKVTYHSVDKAGNEEASHTGYVNIDREKPTLVVDLSPRRASGWYNKDVKVTPTALDALSGVEKVQYREGDDPAWHDVVGGFFTLTSAANSGEHTYVCRAIDRAGNEAQQEFTANIDTVGPRTYVKAKSVRVRRTVKLPYRATDALSPEVKKVVIKIKDRRGKVVKRFSLSDRKLVGVWYTISWRPSRVGTYTYSMYCSDLAGNTQRARQTAKIVVRYR